MMEPSIPPTCTRNGSSHTSNHSNGSPHSKSVHHINGVINGNSYTLQNQQIVINEQQNKYEQQSVELYQNQHHRQGILPYYNAPLTSESSMPIGYSLATHPNGTNEIDANSFHFSNHEHHSVSTSTQSGMHLVEPRNRSSGLGLLVESATSSTFGRNDGTNAPDTGNFFNVPFEVSTTTTNTNGNHAYLDHHDSNNGSRPFGIEQSELSPIHAFIRTKENENLWRCGTMSPMGQMDTLGPNVPGSMLPMVSPTTNMYHPLLNSRQMVHPNKLHNSVSTRFQPVYTENSMHQRPVTRPNTMGQQTHHQMLATPNRESTSSADYGKGLCTMCGSSHVQFVVEPCGHFYHAQCAASLNGKTQKMCFCGQEILKFRSLCQSHTSTNSLFPHKVKVMDMEESQYGVRIRTNGSNRLISSTSQSVNAGFSHSDAIASLTNSELFRNPEANNHANQLSMSINHCEPSPNTVRADNFSNPHSDSLLSSISLQDAKPVVRREYRKLRTCAVEGCSRTIRSRGLCKAHGGGKRCDEPGCNLSDQGGGRCINHGGGKRCQVKDCKNSAQSKGLCKQHGGGSRCTHPGCSKSSQGYGRCRAHGGGRRCRVEGCEKTDRRGGYCVTHGADRKCTVLECMKTARMQGLCTNHYFGKHPAPTVTNGRNLLA